jgi:hypothetical protein
MQDPLPPAGGWDPLDPDYWEARADNPYKASCMFLDWDTPAAAAQTFNIPRTDIQGLLWEVQPPPQDGAVVFKLKLCNLIEQEINAPGASRMSAEIDRCGIFSVQYNDRASFVKAVKSNPQIDLTELAVRAADMGDVEDFHGQVAPGPDELSFLHLTLLSELYEAGAKADAESPFGLLGRLTYLLGAKARDDTRQEQGSSLRVAGDLLRAYVVKHSGISAEAGNRLLAIRLPAMLVACAESMLLDLRTPGVDSKGHLDDLVDSMTLITGKDTEAATVFWRRAHLALASFVVLKEMQPASAPSSTFRLEMERLGSHLSPKLTYGPNAFLLLTEIDKILQQRGKLQSIKDLVAAGATLNEVISNIIDSAEISGGEGLSNSGVSNERASAGEADQGAMRNAQVDKALSAVGADVLAKAAGQTGVDFQDTTFRAQSALLLRFQAFQPTWLRPRHAIFEQMTRELPSQILYFSRNLVMQPGTGVVPDTMNTFVWSVDQMKKFLHGEWQVEQGFDPVNEGGLRLRALQHGTVYLPVVAGELYVLESALLCMRDFCDRLYRSVKYPLVATGGLTWAAAVDEQVELLRYIDGLPSSEKAAWLDWARENFRAAIEFASMHWTSYLTSSAPSEARLTCWLPDASPFVSNIRNRLKKAEPISIVRQAFPSFFSGEAILLPGASAAGSSAGTSAVGGKQKAASALARYLNADTLFLVGYTYDVKGIAKKYNVDKTKMCWIRFLTTKTGAEALELCGNCSRSHTPPQGFDRAAVAASFSKKATPEQMASVGWKDYKKAKN